MRDIANKRLNPGNITHYIVNGEIIVCGFYHTNGCYSYIEDIFKKTIRLDSGFKYLAIQSGSIESGSTFQHITWIVLILRSFTNQCELWLCGQDEPIEKNYDQYCRNKRHSIHFSSDSPNPKDYKYSRYSNNIPNSKWNQSSSRSSTQCCRDVKTV